MKMNEGETSGNVSKLIPNKADILYRCVFSKFIAKHFLISVFIQATNN
uniref:RNA-binding protein, putative n=1 Tax=Arundo donax TaxID=35708 RepID=A0A0A9CTE9_ARUDO